MTQDRAVCTIIAKNYLASARTLAQSFLDLHPHYRSYVLIVDDFDDYIDLQHERFEIIRLADLKIPNLPELCFKYDVQELCTAVKARLLDYLIHEKKVGELLYLDPDILVTGSLDGLFEKLGTHDIVLTPHLDADYPDDDLLPNDGYILRAGQFNLGFIGLNSSANAQSFLDWWKSKLHEKCVSDAANGYFVDQKFIDFLPLFFDRVWIEKNVGYNVAYWNLHSRRIAGHDNQWKCNDGPLYFFHFSGYRPDSSSLSHHIPASLARYSLSNRKDLQELFAHYRELLIANGYRSANAWPYTFDYFKSGERITSEIRLHYRRFPAKRGSFGNPFESGELKRLNGGGQQNGKTSSEQLQEIMNSRAWRWVCRYGRVKNRFLAPSRQFFAHLSGARRKVISQPEKN